jgi:hypothetical protein
MPCGAKFLVSAPNQLAPAIMYSFPVGVMILGPLVDQPPPAAGGSGGAEAFVRLTVEVMDKPAIVNTDVNKIIFNACISAPPSVVNEQRLITD